MVGPTKDPTEQQTGDLDPPFKGGGRRADLPADYQQRAAADADYDRNLRMNARQDREAIGIARQMDGTPWVQSGSGHPKADAPRGRKAD